jgi:membrane associated rhomboid family serine protease
MKKFFTDLDSQMKNWLSPVVRWIVYICAGVYLLTFLLAPSPRLMQWIFYTFGASPAFTIGHAYVWQLVTYAFVHVSFTHLLFNMIGLYFFGQRLEYRWGSREFLKFTIVVGIGAVLFHLLVSSLLSLGQGLPPDVIVGISGVIFGVMAACALIYPDDIVYFQFLLPIKMKYFVVIMGVLTLISIPNSQSSVAHLTHLGGLGVGLIYVKYPWLFDWIKMPHGLPRRSPPSYPWQEGPGRRGRKF